MPIVNNGQSDDLARNGNHEDYTGIHTDRSDIFAVEHAYAGWTTYFYPPSGNTDKMRAQSPKQAQRKRHPGEAENNTNPARVCGHLLKNRW